MAREDIKAGDFLNTGTNGALGDADRAEDAGVGAAAGPAGISLVDVLTVFG